MAENKQYIEEPSTNIKPTHLSSCKILPCHLNVITNLASNEFQDYAGGVITIGTNVSFIDFVNKIVHLELWALSPASLSFEFICVHIASIIIQNSYMMKKLLNTKSQKALRDVKFKVGDTIDRFAQEIAYLQVLNQTYQKEYIWLVGLPVILVIHVNCWIYLYTCISFVWYILPTDQTV